VNTEELERSLRTEFDEHFVRVLADARTEFDTLQKSLEAQFESQRAQMDEAFRAIQSRLEAPPQFDQAFTESVVEHLRLARDEGARVTATAMDAAEKLHTAPEDQSQGFSHLRDSIADIKSQKTQAAILRSLVDAAANFAPRGAFFIVKNDHLVGWKTFGTDLDESVARSIHFPQSADTILSQSVSSLSLRSGSALSCSGNMTFLDPLGFGSPEYMIAVPLSARGRGVAVLYADGGMENGDVNSAALDALVSVASLTVEMLAGVAERPVEQPVTAPQPEARSETTQEPAAEEEVSSVAEEAEYIGDVSVAEAKVEDAPEETADEVEHASNGFAFSQNNFSDHQVAEPEAEVEVAEVQQAEPVAAEPRRRYGQIDLPIEVSDDERKPHTDARRFARLLVSEIKMYNEKKVFEARESGEIYDVLKEAIDRSREMYDKRVQPDVAAKFDYFHYELVNSLAEGDEEKLGAGYLALKA
jgi:hypothetical protein